MKSILHRVWGMKADAPENGEITESTVMRWEVRDAMLSALNRAVPLARTGKLSAILAAAARG